MSHGMHVQRAIDAKWARASRPSIFMLPLFFLSFFSFFLENSRISVLRTKHRVSVKIRTNTGSWQHWHVIPPPSTGPDDVHRPLACMEPQEQVSFNQPCPPWPLTPLLEHIGRWTVGWMIHVPAHCTEHAQPLDKKDWTSDPSYLISSVPSFNWWARSRKSMYIRPKQKKKELHLASHWISESGAVMQFFLQFFWGVELLTF